MPQGQPVAKAVQAIGVIELTFSRWRKDYGWLKTNQVKRLKELEKVNERLRKAVSDQTLEKLILTEAAPGRLLSPALRRHCVDHVIQKFRVSERLTCRVLGQHRSNQRKVPSGRRGEEAASADIITLASQYGRYGYSQADIA